MSYLRVSLGLIPTKYHVKFGIAYLQEAHLSQKVAQRSVSFKTLLSYSRSCEMTPLSMARVSFYSIISITLSIL